MGGSPLCSSTQQTCTFILTTSTNIPKRPSTFDRLLPIRSGRGDVQERIMLPEVPSLKIKSACQALALGTYPLGQLN
jgi:hypothetical protein